MKNNLKVLIASLRRVRPFVPYAGTFEFEDTVQTISGADVLSYSQADLSAMPLFDRVTARLGKSLRVEIRRRPKPEIHKVSDTYDLFLARIMSPGELGYLDQIEGWQERATLKAIWIEEFWPNMLRYKKMLRPLSLFDQIFVGNPGVTERLTLLTGTPCNHIAPGVDALRFNPFPNPPTRFIDVYSMGRRSSKTHAALMTHARADAKFMYLYDSAELDQFTQDHRQHRELVAGLIKRSGYFVTNRAKVNEAEQTEGAQVYGPRFFEGAAAGAILVGEPPDCDLFRSDFNWRDAIVPLSYDATNAIEVIDEFAADKARVSDARKAGILGVLERHDWLHRWRKILETLGLGLDERSEARANLLRSRSAEVRDNFNG
jgi:Glycosyl transferases group 1